MNQSRTRAKEPLSLEALPKDVMCLIIKKLDFDDKLQLQLVSQKLCDLMTSPPQGERMWGECNLSANFSKFVKDDGFINPNVRRWLVKRVPHMTRIYCNSSSDKVLCGLLPYLSGLVAPATELSIYLNKQYTVQLLHCKANAQPGADALGFWRTLSDCLTELTIEVDWTQQQLLWQPELLSQLTALTALTICVLGGDEEEVQGSDILHLPQLKRLHVDSYYSRHLILECPQLTSLSLESCESMGPVSLRAPLQELFVHFSGKFAMHPGFPLTNFLDIVSMSIECVADSEKELYRALPLMRRLRSLDLAVNQGNLLQSLPQGLCDITLYFSSCKYWDNAVIPVLQQLPELRELRIEFWTVGLVFGSPAKLSSDLRPFMALPKLRILQLGEWQAWTTESLRALGQFEAELVRSGSKIELIYSSPAADD